MDARRMASVGSPPPGIKSPPANVSRRNAVTAASAGPNTIVRLPRRSFIVYPTADRSVTAASIADGCPVILRNGAVSSASETPDSGYARSNEISTTRNKASRNIYGGMKYVSIPAAIPAMIAQLRTAPDTAVRVRRPAAEAPRTSESRARIRTLLPSAAESVFVLKSSGKASIMSAIPQKRSRNDAAVANRAYFFIRNISDVYIPNVAKNAPYVFAGQPSAFVFNCSARFMKMDFSKHRAIRRFARRTIPRPCVAWRTAAAMTEESNFSFLSEYDVMKEPIIPFSVCSLHLSHREPKTLSFFSLA